jgi:hypothetical protein
MCLPNQGLINDEREEAPQVLGSGKDLTGEDSVELIPDSGIPRVVSSWGTCPGFGEHRGSVRTGGSVQQCARDIHQPISGGKTP